jgi:hypothetical protein
MGPVAATALVVSVLVILFCVAANLYIQAST